MNGYFARWSRDNSPRSRRSLAGVTSASKSLSRRAKMSLELLEDRAVPAVFTVNSLADVLTPPTGVVTLRSAIQAANNTPGNNTINIAVAGTYKIAIPGANTGTNASGAFTILPNGGNLTIQNTSRGNVTIDGQFMDRVFDINPTAQTTTPFLVTIQGVTITNGDASPGDGAAGSGGGIRDQGSASLTLINDTVTNCFATADGGGVSMENTVNNPWHLTIQNSTFTNDHGGDAGGAIEEDGQGVVVITNSNISNNTTVNQGAGIWLDAINNGTVNVTANTTLTNDLFNNNVAFNGPTGAIGNAGNATVTISGTTVENNFVGGTTQGGAGFGDQNGLGTLHVTNSLFLNNVAVTNGGAIFTGASGTVTTVVNTLIQGNAGQSGGGIEDAGTTLTLTNDTFNANHAVAANGGTGGDGGGLDVQTASSVTINNSLFLSNTAVNGTMTSNNGNINTATTTFLGDGGGIFQSVGDLTVTNSQFTGNVASVDGGGLAFFGTTLAVSDVTFNANKATSGAGGALALSPTGTVAADTGSTITNSTIAGNSAVTNGGGIVDVGPGDLALLYDTINANTAGNEGGGVAFMPNTGTPILSFENTIVAGNVAMTGPDVFSDTAITDNGGNLVPTAGQGNSGFGPGTIMSNPKLSTLQNNGGALAGVNPFPGYGGLRQVVQTEALLSNSPAINHAVNVALPVTDERGFPRPGRIFSNPAIGAYEPQFIGAPTQSFVIGTDNQVYARATDTSGNVTGGYYLVAPGQVKALATARAGDTGVELFVIGTDNQVYAATIDASGNVNGYFAVAPGQVKAIATGNDASGDPEFFVIGMDNQVYAEKLDISGNPVGGYFATAPGAVSSIGVGHDASNNPEVFAVGTDGGVYAQKFDATGSPLNLGGYFATAHGKVKSISVTNDATNNPVLFAVGTDGMVYSEKFDPTGTTQSGYVPTGFGPVLSIAVGNDASGNPELFGVGMDSQVYGLKFNPSDAPNGKVFLTAPGKVSSIGVGANATDQPELYAVMSSDNQVYVMPFDSTGTPTAGYSLYNKGPVKAISVK